jgi:hypothetical protein
MEGRGGEETQGVADLPPPQKKMSLLFSKATQADSSIDFKFTYILYVGSFVGLTILQEHLKTYKIQML